MLIYLRKKAQSTAEYVIILGLVVGAVVAMQTFVKRGLQGRIRDAVKYRDTDETGNAGTYFTGEQYEPYYLKSDFDTESNTVESEAVDTGGGTVERQLNQEHTQRNGSQNILDAANRVY